MIPNEEIKATAEMILERMQKDLGVKIVLRAIEVDGEEVFSELVRRPIQSL